MKPYDFTSLFILDLANNHQGDVAHACRIIRECGDAVSAAGVRAALKFQFRELDTFVHPAHREGSGNKHIPRFLGTRLREDDFARLAEEVRQAGMITMATPFDEASVDLIERLDLEIIKIASCSAADWPLVHRIMQSRRPVVASTAGMGGHDLDHLVDLLEQRGVAFALMHCVAVYPTPNEQLKLNRIDLLRSRFPGVPVGFSTHELPDNLLPVVAAVAKGATLFERHVGIATEQYPLNSYSARPDQLAPWFEQWKLAAAMCGGARHSPPHPDEIASLNSLRRGVFARRPLTEGEVIRAEDVYFAMPWSDGQLDTSNWHSGLRASRSYEADEPVSERVLPAEPAREEIVYQIMLQVRGMFNRARIHLGRESRIEISHHYGLSRFREFGAVIVDCVNRSYCKKLIVVLPRQKHPYHYHQKKEETFQLLHGDLEIEVNGERRALEPGDMALIEPGNWHKFHSLGGAIFEEISTTHYDNDSFYEDRRIAQLPRELRKTELKNWRAAMPHA